MLDNDGAGNSLTSPEGVMRSNLLSMLSKNHKFPSESDVINAASPPSGIGNCLISPVREILISRATTPSAIQRLPSEQATIESFPPGPRAQSVGASGSE